MRVEDDLKMYANNSMAGSILGTALGQQALAKCSAGPS